MPITVSFHDQGQAVVAPVVLVRLGTVFPFDFGATSVDRRGSAESP